MAQRKPPAVTFERWVDQQIRTAQERGAFDGLAGAGRPLTDLDTPRGELEWIAGLMRRENVDPSILLPPSLTLPKEMEELRGRLAREASEATVREIVTDLNQRIREAHRRPQVGPPLLVMSVDVERMVQRWRDDRAEMRRRYEQDQAAAAAAAPAPVPEPVRRRWWRPRRR